MKPIYLTSCLAILISLINLSCKKETQNITYSQSTSPPTTFIPPSSNQDIWAHANMDITIELPMNSTILNGGTTGPGRTGAIVKWEKISGPASYILESPESPLTKVTNLEKGAYAFKLDATHNSGQISTDTMTLIVQDATSTNKQIFFWNLGWSCSFGCALILEGLLYLPPNSPFTLYIRSEFSSNWELVVPVSNTSTTRFTYSVWGNYINVFDMYNFDPTDHPDIKIVF